MKNPKQAIAIALSESGASNQQSPSQNRRQYRHTKSKERRGQTAQQQKEGRASKRKEPTRAELYKKAQQRGIPGRSHMNKQELARAVHA